jgi:hypothetical protein
MRTYPEYEPPLERQEAGLTMRVIGWTLLVFDALFIALFAPAGLRDGSVLWPVWAVVQALVGFVLATAGAKMEDVTGPMAGSIVPMPPVYRPDEEPRRAA